ncbi:MAG: 3'(2'),5'-bisphosphate nucleotidase CysQ [Actinomycetota bacterium]|nr:3'(2'),5'-bisphosphate nucleotidase CysQ [Actinomycetota bacterium]
MTEPEDLPPTPSRRQPRPDAAVAVAAAEHGGRVLLGVRSAATRSSATLGDQGDRAAHTAIVAALSAACPTDAILSEEAADDQARLVADRVWIVDPLDGTREFAERGRVDWAVHVALVVGGDLVAGAVALPALGVTMGTGSPPALAPPHDGPPRMVVSRTRPPALAVHVATCLGAETVPLGSAGAKAMAVVRGDADIYLHAGGQYEWDSAAPVAVATAAGLHASRVDGSPLRYNQPDPWLPDLLICRPELADEVIAAAAAAPPQ